MKITVDDAQAAAGTEFDSTVLDMAGFNAVLWVVKLGTSDSGNFAKGQEAATADMSGAQDLLGTKAAGQKILVVDVQRPAQRYVRCAVIRAGVNTTVDAVVALQYDASKLPITQAAAIALAQVFGPAEGAVN
ncbi:MAG TPA: hypothetical protein VFA59_06610 [Vicinamibacterales bacterium]|nr:hypothetical protein [Vicinamibacterales bacterium]